MKAELQEIASQFALEGAITAIDSLGEGFINDTFIVRTAGDAPDYILQRKNKSIFPDVPAMMENIRKVTDHIRRRVAAAGGDPRREAMTVVATRDGKLYHVDAQGEYWAVSVFISDTIAYNKADSPELARKGGEGIGKFQAQLADLTEPLAETIKKELGVVTPDLNTPVSRLSGGNVQKVLVGRELAADPIVLMTAYAVRGLDINTSYTIYHLLNEQKKRGVAVIYVGEDLDVLLELCDRIVVLCGGKVNGILDGRKTTKEEVGLRMTNLVKEEQA